MLECDVTPIVDTPPVKEVKSHVNSHQHSSIHSHRDESKKVSGTLTFYYCRILFVPSKSPRFKDLN